MDFELIDKLNDEDVLNLFNDISVSEKITFCHCLDEEGTIIRGAYNCDWELYDEDSCHYWCDKHIGDNVAKTTFYHKCECFRPGGMYFRHWSTCELYW